MASGAMISIVPFAWQWPLEVTLTEAHAFTSESCDHSGNEDKGHYSQTLRLFGGGFPSTENNLGVPRPGYLPS
jgi:hypothetical protein